MPIHISIPQIIINSIEEGRAKSGRAIVAVDGRGGAGKSSLARAIVATVPDSTHAEYDWFHLPRDRVTQSEHFDTGRLIRELLNPFRAGQKAVTFRRYNWGYLAGTEDGLDPAPISLSLGAVLVLEGCSTLHHALDEFYDVRVWLDTSPEESFRRGTSRDIEEYRLDPMRVQAGWEDWAKWEAQDSTLNNRRKRANFIL